MEVNKIVINLPERTDRLQKFDQRFRELFEGSYTVVEGVRNKIPFHGIAQAHMNAIKIAKDNNWDKVLIMEDDVLFSPSSKKYMDKIYSDLPKDWDILLGGLYWSRMMVEHNKNWYKTSEFCALHYYIVNQKAYDKLLKFDYSNHFDRWVGTQGLNVYVPKKFFAIQEDGYSDNVNKLTDYNSTYLSKFEILK